ncbi:MAG: OmpA family protein [Alphaproteobacteria bacterium]|nr:OmpA family protein [Alphaproteobacteria bacterium]
MTNRRVMILVLSGLLLAGFVGAARAETDDRAVVRDTQGQIVHLSNGTCVRTKGMSDQDACASRRIAQQVTTQQKTVTERKTRPLSDFTREDRTAYFAFDHFDLSPEATARLDTLSEALKADRTVKEARIVGYADRIGTVSYNQRLSQKRAEIVRDYLIAKGYTNARVTETRWVGKSEPSADCPAGEKRPKLIVCLQKDRRVEVEIGLIHDKTMPDSP